MRKGLVTLLMLCATLTASAQQDDEYLMEIGGGVGMVSYQGDFNGKITSGMQPAGAIVWRRLLNPYMGFRVTVMMGKLKGDDRESLAGSVRHFTIGPPHAAVARFAGRNRRDLAICPPGEHSDKFFRGGVSERPKVLASKASVG